MTTNLQEIKRWLLRSYTAQNSEPVGRELAQSCQQELQNGRFAIQIGNLRAVCSDATQKRQKGGETVDITHIV